MGIIALPAMLARKYDTKIAMGSIMAGGTLGILIPPSILAIQLFGLILLMIFPQLILWLPGIVYG